MPEFEDDRSWLLDVSCKGLELTSKKLWLATDIIAMHVCYGKVPTNHFRHKANNIALGCFSGGHRLRDLKYYVSPACEEPIAVWIIWVVVRIPAITGVHYIVCFFFVLFST